MVNKQLDQLIKKLDQLCPKCREQKINIFLELIYIHLDNDNCLDCSLRSDVIKLIDNYD